MGRLALWFDDECEAQDRLQRAARAAPDQARIQNALGDAFGLAAQKAGLFAKLGWARKCLGAYERAVALDPRKAAYRWSLLGYYCVAPRIAGGAIEKARAQAEAISQLDPMEGKIAAATVLLSERRHSDAFAQFDEDLKGKAETFLALYHVGRCAAISGEQLARGRAALEKCLLMVPPSGDGMPSLASTHHRLGNILDLQGDSAGAQKHYSAALKLLPDFRGEKESLRN